MAEEYAAYKRDRPWRQLLNLASIGCTSYFDYCIQRPAICWPLVLYISPDSARSFYFTFTCSNDFHGKFEDLSQSHDFLGIMVPNPTWVPPFPLKPHNMNEVKYPLP